MAQATNPKLIFHADWGSHTSKRLGAKATLDGNGRYTVNAPQQVLNPDLLIEQLRNETGDADCAFLGFDFPIGIPVHYAKRAGIASFRAFLFELGCGEWQDFSRVCDKPEEISEHRPFYPNGQYKGRRKEDLLRAHGVVSVEHLLRQCERGGNGRKQACCLFWTLGGNQVGKAAITGWRDVLAPALRNGELISLWPFDGPLRALFMPGRIVVAETYPAECYGWFPERFLGSKRKTEDRKKFSAVLLRWAESNDVVVEDDLRRAMQNGFSQGRDDAFDAVVGLFGMLDVLLGNRRSGEPRQPPSRTVEGWILGRLFRT